MKGGGVMGQPLQGERICLIPIQLAHAPELFKIWSNPKITEFMNIDPFCDEKQAGEMIVYLKNLAKEQKALRYTIFHKEQAKIMGSCGFNQIDTHNQHGEIGYELDEAFWRQGYGSEVVEQLVNHGFSHLHMVRISAKVEAANKASIHVLEKNRFQYEGTLRKAEKSKGAFIDLCMYARLKHD